MSASASPFPILGEDDWRKAAVAALKGGSLEKLVSRTSDGVAFGPLHAATSGPRALRREPGAWRALARVDHPEAGEANEAARDDLPSGADGLQIVFAGAAGAYGFGLARSDSATLHRALEGVRFDDGLRFELDLGPDGVGQAKRVAELIARAGADAGKVDIAFGLDPLGLALRAGRAQSWDDEGRALALTVRSLAAVGFRGPFAAADGRAVHAAGGTPAQELAFALASAVAYWRALEQHGLSPADACAAISFRLAADADEFVTLAKFRALRLLWANVTEAAGVAAAPVRIHAESAWRMMSVRDPFINVMRAAVGAFSAGLGGADSVSLLPFSRAIGLPDSFARRLARNTQLVELRESNLGFVADPAAGAGVFEALTTGLCEKAWARFQAFEAAGGVASALRTGAFQGEIAAAAAALVKDVARLKTPLTGVSVHPDIHEAPIEVRPAVAPEVEFSGERFADPLAPMRVGAAFERLRDGAETLAERPRIYLAAINTPSSNSRRVSFARDLFEAGGFATANELGADTADEAIAQWRANGAEIACLCGSDDDYAAKAGEFATALKAVGVKHLILAGRPGDHEAAWRAAGVDEFVFAGQDAVATLSALLKRAGAAL